MPDTDPPRGRALWWAHWPELGFLLALPVLLLGVNTAWFSNKPGDTDTWLYYGHFLRFFDGVAPGGNVPIDYYRTRLAYILPGALLYRVFADGAAQFLFMVLVHGCIIVPFWYVARSAASRPVAFATAALLALDIYFVRLIGWQYVDNGVLAYQALTFGFITAATRGATPLRHFALAGFCAASMVFTHLGAAILLPVFIAYTYVLLTRAAPDVPLGLRLLPAVRGALLGGLACQAIYGLVNIVANNGDFVFVFEQLIIGVNEAITMSAAQPAWFLARSGDWLTAHGVALLGSVIGVAAWRARGVPWLDTRLFWLVATAALLGLVTLLEGLHVTYFLSRDGEYVSFFLIPSYMAIGALLFPSAITGWRLVGLAVAVVGVGLVYRLAYSGVPAGLPTVPVAVLAVVGGVAVALPVLLGRTHARVAACVVAVAVFGAVTVLTPSAFSADPSIRQTARMIRMLAGPRIPRIFLAKDDPAGLELLRSIVACFTERAWGRHGEAYPDFARNAWPPFGELPAGDVVVVLGSTVTHAAAAQVALDRFVRGSRLLGSFMVSRDGSTVWAHLFEITGP